MKLIYPAVFHQEDNAYWVEFPDLEGCNSFGDTLEETLTNAREALEGYSISLIEHKEKLPTPSDIGSLKTSDGFVSLVDIDLSAYFNQKKAVKKTLTIPEWLNEAEQIAAVCNISREAAQIRAERMEVLRKRGKFLTSPLERKVYQQFKNYIQNNRL